MKSIYQPNTDSYLMSDVLNLKFPKLLKINPNLTFLEIGSGSALQLQKALGMGVKLQNIFGCDINPQSVKHCQGLGFNCIKSDLFSNIDEKFDLVVFNPPYLQKDPQEPLESQISTTGGDLGSEIINEFLHQAKDYLNIDGKIFLLISNLTKGIEWNSWNKKLLAQKKIFFEELFVWLVTIK